MKSEELGLLRSIASVKKDIADAEIDLLIQRDHYASLANMDSDDESYRRRVKSQALHIEKQKIVIALLHLTLDGYESQLKNLSVVA